MKLVFLIFNSAKSHLWTVHGQFWCLAVPSRSCRSFHPFATYFHYFNKLLSGCYIALQFKTNFRSHPRFAGNAFSLIRAWIFFTVLNLVTANRAACMVLLFLQRAFGCEFGRVEWEGTGETKNTVQKKKPESGTKLYFSFFLTNEIPTLMLFSFQDEPYFLAQRHTLAIFFMQNEVPAE